MLTITTAKMRAAHRTWKERIQFSHILFALVLSQPKGLLTDNLTQDKFSSIRAVKMTGVKFDDLHELRDRLTVLARKYSCTMAQVSMNWVRGKGAVPLVGVRSVPQIEDAAGCTNFELTDEEMKSLDGASLGLSLFDRPLYRRSLFVVFISILQLVYSTDIWYTKVKKLCSFVLSKVKNELFSWR